MNGIRRFGLVLLGASLLAPLADAQVTRSGNGYLFRQKYTKGQTIRYNMTMEQQGAAQGQAMKIAMPMTQTVRDVNKGVADLTIRVGPMTMNGRPMGEAQTLNLKMDARNQIVGGASGPSGQMQAVLPQGAIRVGQTWTSDMPLQGMPGGGNAKATYKFNGIKNVGGRQVAEVGVTFTTTGSPSMTGNGTMLILVSDGSLQRSNLTMSTSMKGQDGRTNTIRFVMNMTRQ
jgi:hypothetical protein